MVAYSFTLYISSSWGKTYLVQATTRTDCPVSGPFLHNPGVEQSPDITILLCIFDMFDMDFFFHFASLFLGVIGISFGYLFYSLCSCSWYLPGYQFNIVLKTSVHVGCIPLIPPS